MLKIAYLLDSFPVLSETFILQEIVLLQRQEVPLRLFSLFEPAADKVAMDVLDGRIPVAYISHESRLKLLAVAFQHFLRNPKRFLQTAIGLIVHNPLRPAIASLLYAAYVVKQIRHQGVTHLHAHFAGQATSVAQAVYQLTGIPYSFTTHAYDIYLSRKEELTYKMHMARFIVACSSYNQQYLEKLVDQKTRQRIHCIYLGVNLDIFPSNRNTISLAEKIPVILSVARLVEKKGLLYLLYACRILKDRGYQFICRIVGDGPQRPILEQKIRELALSDNVELFGAAAHKQVIEMYQQATIVALPCIVAENGDRDGLPIALVEALHMRVPVVSTTVSGVPELIANEVNGLLVPPQNSQAFAAALARLLNEPLLCCRLTQAGSKTVQERFDMAKNVQHLLDLMCAGDEL